MLVLELDGPFAVQTAAMTTDPATRVDLRLKPTTQADFAQEADWLKRIGFTLRIS